MKKNITDVAKAIFAKICKYYIVFDNKLWVVNRIGWLDYINSIKPNVSPTKIRHIHCAFERYLNTVKTNVICYPISERIRTDFYKAFNFYKVFNIRAFTRNLVEYTLDNSPRLICL